jgi:hypothetical protein
MNITFVWLASGARNFLPQGGFNPMTALVISPSNGLNTPEQQPQVAHGVEEKFENEQAFG